MKLANRFPCLRRSVLDREGGVTSPQAFARVRAGLQNDPQRLRRTALQLAGAEYLFDPWFPYHNEPWTTVLGDLCEPECRDQPRWVSWAWPLQTARTPLGKERNVLGSVRGVSCLGAAEEGAEGKRRGFCERLCQGSLRTTHVRPRAPGRGGGARGQ